MNAPTEFEWATPNTGPAGWYATVHCWEPEEGMFPGAHRWDGKKWEWDGPIVAHAGPFATKEEAKAWADAHDPEAAPS